MAIPSVTCGADVELNYSAGTQNVSLSASGTGSPTSYAWTLLAVPVGSTALTETRGNFINGVSTTQNPSFVTDGAIAGSYIFQCIATNGEGASSPSIDKENAQQIVFVKTQKFGLKIPNDYMWDWGSSLNTTLTTIETNIPTSFTASEITNFQPAVAGTVDVSANTAARHSHSNKSQLDLVSDGDHDIRTDNPHSVTSSQVGLGNVSNPTTKGDLITYSTTGSILPIGTNNQILTVDTSTSTGLKWTAASGVMVSGVTFDTAYSNTWFNGASPRYNVSTEQFSLGFIDDFTSATLDSRWTQVTGTDGVITGGVGSNGLRLQDGASGTDIVFIHTPVLQAYGFEWQFHMTRNASNNSTNVYTGLFETNVSPAGSIQAFYLGHNRDVGGTRTIIYGEGTNAKTATSAFDAIWLRMVINSYGYTILINTANAESAEPSTTEWTVLAGAIFALGNVFKPNYFVVASNAFGANASDYTIRHLKFRYI